MGAKPVSLRIKSASVNGVYLEHSEPARQMVMNDVAAFRLNVLKCSID